MSVGPVVLLARPAHGEVVMRVPKRWALFFTGIAGIFGIRTPPDPEVVAQMSPAKGTEGQAPPGTGRDPRLQVELKREA
jgi:hypothetical protein